MLKPSKHAHPDKTVVAVATLLLHRLKTQRVENFDNLRQYLAGVRAGVGTLFLPALNLLFVLGLVEYRPKTDAFEYTG
ncbi:MAG: hypothetical protein Q7U97_02005, partial [Rhodocyclaceae bacterium]|nr:hypothetical protein [Rhodocyclaceae bacterium]